MTDHTLVTELRDLADHPYLAARGEQLRDLADAIAETGQDDIPEDGKAVRWCEVDLFSAFAPGDTVLPSGAGDHSGGLPGSPEAKPSSRGSGFRRWVPILSHVLVFLPIVVTWLGLKMATDAYGQTLKADGVEAARHPFLEMWQQGFGGRLAEFWEFDNVALLTLAAIGVLVVVTVADHRLRNGEEDAADRRERDLDRELAVLRGRLRNALTRASLTLGQVRLASPARFTAELTKAAAQINRVGNTTRRAQTELVDALTRALEATQKATDALMAGAADVQGSIGSLDRHLTGINAACIDLATAVDRISSVVDDAGTRATEAVGQAGDQLATAISQTTLGLRESFNEELVRSIETIRKTVAVLDARVGELAGNAAGIGVAVDRVAVSVGAMGAGTERAVASVGDRLATALTGTSADFRDAFGTVGAEIRDALGTWSDAAGAHASRIETVSGISGRTANVLEDTRNALDRLPATLDGVLAGLPFRIKEITESDFSDLTHAITRLQDALDRATDVIGGAVPNGAAAGLVTSDGVASGGVVPDDAASCGVPGGVVTGGAVAGGVHGEVVAGGVPSGAGGAV
ncbi:hypothetical protein ACWDUI_18415 [Streptosporangium sandarakinum]|uniref:hypothetical protein n=1 Tax=Streptosporangium sandarakinum TaxID=1260955 RepID=UPI0037B68DA3